MECEGEGNHLNDDQCVWDANADIIVGKSRRRGDFARSNAESGALKEVQADNRFECKELCPDLAVRQFTPEPRAELDDDKDSHADDEAFQHCDPDVREDRLVAVDAEYAESLRDVLDDREKGEHRHHLEDEHAGAAVKAGARGAWPDVLLFVPQGEIGEIGHLLFRVGVDVGEDEQEERADANTLPDFHPQGQVDCGLAQTQAGICKCGKNGNNGDDAHDLDLFSRIADIESMLCKKDERDNYGEDTKCTCEDLEELMDGEGADNSFGVYSKGQHRLEIEVGADLPSIGVGRAGHTPFELAESEALDELDSLD